MGKILFLLLAVIVAWLLFKGVLGKAAARKRQRASLVHEKMIPCDLCGVHMPESESALCNGQRTCRLPAQCVHRQGK